MAETIDRYKQALYVALEALQFYADPETYHAIALIADRPAGGFADDCSRVKDSWYDRPMPGKTARQAIRKLERSYGSLRTAAPTGKRSR